MYSSNINPPYVPPQTSSRHFPSQYDPSTSAYSCDDSDLVAKLELLKQKKADIWKHFAQETPSTDYGNNLNLPMAPQPQTKPRDAATMPIIDPLFYKNLGMQANGLIHVIKVTCNCLLVVTF